MRISRFPVDKKIFYSLVFLGITTLFIYSRLIFTFRINTDVVCRSALIDQPEFQSLFYRKKFVDIQKGCGKDSSTHRPKPIDTICLNRSIFTRCCKVAEIVKQTPRNILYKQLFRPDILLPLNGIFFASGLAENLDEEITRRFISVGIFLHKKITDD